ncbi:hypothetical protein pb186bvf_020761 [Paramecium bursaria]
MLDIYEQIVKILQSHYFIDQLKLGIEEADDQNTFIVIPLQTSLKLLIENFRF